MKNMENCKFCEIYSEKKFDFENELAFAFWDANPVSKGHIIFMTKRHVENFFETTKEEKRDLFELIDKAKNIIDNKEHSVLKAQVNKEDYITLLNTWIHSDTSACVSETNLVSGWKNTRLLIEKYIDTHK